VSRIRYLKPDFFIDEDIADLPYEIRLFFQGLWCSADKAGRLEDRPKKLKVQIMPYDNVDAEKMLNLLAKPKNGSKRQFIIRYEIDGEKYIQIVNWDKHQKPHHTEKDSIIPPYNPLLKTKIKRMGKINQLNPSSELDNGDLTVKVNACLDKEQFTFLKDKDFTKAFQDYLHMRKSIKKPATDIAQKLVLKDLHKHDIKTAIAMLEQSIRSSWTDVYELKPSYNKQSIKRHSEPYPQGEVI